MNDSADKKALNQYRKTIGNSGITMKQFKERRDRFQPVAPINIIPKDKEEKN